MRCFANSPGHLAWRERNGGDEQIFGAESQDAHEEQSYLRMRRLDAGYERSEDVAA